MGLDFQSGDEVTSSIQQECDDQVGTEVECSIRHGTWICRSRPCQHVIHDLISKAQLKTLPLCRR